jgi:hypothetical protein
MAMNDFGGAMTCRQLLRLGALLAVSMIVGGACDRDRPSRAERAVERVGAVPEPELAPFQACTRDEDCTWTTNGCCDCVNGGIEIGVARGQEAAFKERLACTTKNVVCRMMGSDRPCGTGEIKCESSRCVFHSSVDQLP